MNRPILWVTLFTICGIYLRLGRSEMMCLVSFLFAAINISRFVTQDKNIKSGFLLVFLLLGFVLAGRAGAGETVSFGAAQGTGIVQETGETSGGNQKLTILGDLENEAGDVWQNQKIYGIWTGESRFAIGDEVVFSGEIVPFYEAAFPGAYDEKQSLLTKGIDCKLYPEELRKIGSDVSARTLLAKGRLCLQNVLDTVLPAEESGIMKAMLTGEKDDIPDEIYDLYTRAGVTHILCISGLHMSMLALYVSVLLEKLLKQSRRISAAVTMAVALGFLVFTGITPSAVRAVTMICIVMLGRMLFCLPDRWNTIAIAALVILLAQPMYLFHAGFQLSFLTVSGIYAAAERMEQQKSRERKRLNGWKETFFVSLYASLFSFPIVAYHFYSISLAGILANLVILPLSGILLGLGLLSSVIGLICLPGAVFTAGSVYMILQIFKGTCRLLTELPFSYMLVGRPSLLTILLYYVLLLFVLTREERKGSWRIGIVLCAALWCSVFGNRMFRKENTIAFLDVGQGDAAVLSTYDGKAYLVDGGGVFGKAFGENKGVTVILPYLEYLGIGKLDGAFLSHPDADHMTGLLEAADAIPTQGIYLSDYPFDAKEELAQIREIAEKNQIPLYTVKAGDSSADGRWECLYPMENLVFGDRDDNHGSMVLRYVYGGVRVLFTGDIGGVDERLLLQEGIDLQAELLKVAHHGSKYSSDEGFLEAVSPKAAVISCGTGNLYGHPHQEALERLEEVDTEIYRTDEAGSIIVAISPEGTWKVETMADQKPFYERIKKE